MMARWCSSLGFLVLLGCASQEPTLVTTGSEEGVLFAAGRAYRMTYDDTFDALKHRLDDLGYNLIRADRDAGVVTTDTRPLREIEHRFCECSELRGFHELGRKVKMTFMVTEIAPRRTRITIRSRFTILWSDGFRTYERFCISKGNLEDEVLDLKER